MFLKQGFYLPKINDDAGEICYEHQVVYLS